MNMKSNDSSQYNRAKKLLSIDTPEEQYELEKMSLHFAFLSGVEKVMAEKGISRKELAQRVGTSTGYLTQLFRGTKSVSFDMLAKIKTALNVDFNVEVTAK